MTHAEAQAAFRTVLQRWETDPQFVVEPLYRISVSGEVAAPNLYTVTSQTTVLQAIAQAGGVTPRARLDRVRLLRGGSEIHVDLTDATGRQSEMRLWSGDQLVIDARRDVWSRTVQPAIGTLGALSSVAYLVGRIMNRW
jgi:protein involved in polysaccharide export with SLBB domain